ncbi:nucleoside-diphosphate-sugar epimerase [Mytilinidion resinicola]|uniref:Nucleoside-diphosphate-sugar epimerase n=1 Tax=Mytilinidion resinicola TaxID=574789 RepID=A0A6A6Z4Z1_9PEZI|nr:nucleoside-diphosphate-sugar epimerase [Mytilinidion resinicola]KAF2816090.1 nucleoside-diphosphate-sugar epimerase [Mytilinidion resinicola]
MADKGELVLVTGGTGFIGVYCIFQCLAAGYRVRTTIRSLKRENDVKKMLEEGEATNIDRLSFAEADLSKDDGWKEAIEGCTYVLHVASPFPPAPPKHEDDLIIPAREGTLRVLRLARDAGVKRVVVTSSFAAIGYGHTKKIEVYDEKTWTNPDGPGPSAYIKSKAIAERAAWDFIEKEGGALELSTVLPVGVFGPVLGPDFSISIQIVQRLLNGSFPGAPNLSFGVVDVRDVADLHLRAMTDPKAKGERFLAVSPPAMTILEMSLALRERLGKAAKKAPTRILPNIVLRLIAVFDKAVSLVLPELGEIKVMSNDKATGVLGWQPRSNVDAIMATAESLIKYDLV